MNLRKDHYRSAVVLSLATTTTTHTKKLFGVFCLYGAVFFCSVFFCLLTPGPLGRGLRNPTKKTLFFKAGVRGGDRMKRGLWCLGRPVWLPLSGYLLAVQPSVAVWTLLEKQKL